MGHIYNVVCPRWIAKLVNITPITMVYGTQITIVTGANLNQLITGGPHIVLIVGLVGGLEHHILGISSSQLTFIFFRGVGQPPTSS